MTEVHSVSTSFRGKAVPLQSSSPLAVERDRFIDVFDLLVEHSLAYVARIDTQGFATVPINTPVMFLGTRVNTINIGGLIRHLMLAEAHWFDKLRTTASGATIPFPDNASVLAGIKDGTPLLDSYRRSHKEGLAKVAKLTAEDLTKTVGFGKRTYSGMGLLWTIHGHHGFHVGQIDLIMRQMNVEPPEYMEWPRMESVIG